MGGNASVPGTRREFPVGAGTRHEASGGGTRREGVAAGWTRVNLPPELAERFSIVEELGSGGEGFVLRVEDSAGTESVVKLYFPKLTFDERATSLLAALPPITCCAWCRVRRLTGRGTRCWSGASTGRCATC